MHMIVLLRLLQVVYIYAAVVPLTLLTVAQHPIGLSDLLELDYGFLSLLLAF